MSRPSAKLVTGVASCVMLLPAGCRRTSADLSVPGEGPRPRAAEPEVCPPCASPKPPAGSPDDRDPPTILGARFVARDRVQLTFSEALAPVEAVNPRQFRLSRAYSMIDSAGAYATAEYYDLAGPAVYDPPLVVVSLDLYDDRPEVLALNLSAPVPVELCEDLLATQTDLDAMTTEPGSNGRRGRVGVFLHYTSRGSEGVRDRVNNPLGDLGAEWALHFGARQKHSYGTEPVVRLDLIPEIGCPDATLTPRGPPGPR
jgi:hypothetical protein